MRWSSPLVLAPVFALACADGASSTDEAAQRGSPGAAQLAEPSGAVREVPCVDEQIAQLPLFDEPAPGLIASRGEGGVFESTIDATAGGLSASQGFVYARFTEAGLEKVELDDEAAFASTDWHIAFRRYVIRLNGGVAGPSDVVAARTPERTDFDALRTPPEGLTYRAEQYYTEACAYVPDSSGVGAPATLLASFWSYGACLAMTRDVFVLRVPPISSSAATRHVKLQVIAYYTLENQLRCDAEGATGTPSGAGNLRVRWAFLD